MSEKSKVFPGYFQRKSLPHNPQQALHPVK
jgi:hypothetical protein